MKKIYVAIVVLGLVGGYVYFSHKTAEPVGFDRSAPAGPLPYYGKEYNQVGLTASRSQQGLIKPDTGRVFAIEITSDSNAIRYFQMFDQKLAQVPSRAASLSAGFQSLKIYKASTSWASAVSLAAKPLGSYQQYASYSLVYSVPIAAAAASSSPTVVRINSSDFGPAKNFVNGIMFGISSTFGSYASISADKTARYTIKVIYE